MKQKQTKKMSKKNDNNYFDEEIEDYVVEFRKEGTTEGERNKIYTNHLYEIFDKMIRIIIHRRKIYKTGEDLESLVSETNVHLWNVLNNSNFNSDKGRAYSYFTKTIHNYLYQKQKNRQKMINDHGLDSINDDENYYIETFYEEQEDFDMAELLEFYKNWLKENIDDLFDIQVEEDEARIAYAILNILESDETGIEKPRHFFFAIYQQTGISNNYRINKVLDVLRNKYFKMKNKYSENLFIEQDEEEHNG